jgi:hypothetical protein
VDESASLNELASHLERLTEAASRLGGLCDEREWREAYAPGKWTRLEVLGHLVDSAAHNHQRFARALCQDSLTAPDYDSGAQVHVQHYAGAPVATVVEAWRAYNRLIGFLIAQIPPEKEVTRCSIGNFAPITLRELAFDYVSHLEHHLRQIFGGRDTLSYSGMPWPPENRWR